MFGRVHPAQGRAPESRGKSQHWRQLPVYTSLHIHVDYPEVKGQRLQQWNEERYTNESIVLCCGQHKSPRHILFGEEDLLTFSNTEF